VIDAARAYGGENVRAVRDGTQWAFAFRIGVRCVRLLGTGVTGDVDKPVVIVDTSVRRGRRGVPCVASLPEPRSNSHVHSSTGIGTTVAQSGTDP
jgi:hypothetical protein